MLHKVVYTYSHLFRIATLDFTATSIDVTFIPGQTTATVEVPITDDSVSEDTEMFSAVLSTTNPNVMLGEDTASVTILDDDSKGLKTSKV